MKLAYPLLLALSACVVAPSDGAENESSVDQAIGCQSWGCGTNSPIVGDGLMFDELDATGVRPNRGGLRIVSAKMGDGTEVKIRAVRQSLVADAVDGSRHYVEGQLSGM